MNKLSLQPYKGTRDFYPRDMYIQNHIFNAMKRSCQLYGYEEYMGPMIEHLDLYLAKTGEEIINNEIYSFTDRGDRQVAIRPEMTPTVARMIAAQYQELAKPIRWYSIPNLFRYEKPQKGRLREHWQLNVDIFGVDNLFAEKEVIDVAIEIMKSLGAHKDMYKVLINNRKLIDLLFDQVLNLDQDQKHNVGKLIDKKAKISSLAFTSGLEENGLDSNQIDQLLKYLESGDESLNTLAQINDDAMDTLKLINAVKEYTHASFEPSLMRGFDYYTGIVFEIFDMSLENNRSMFGGGRYDDLLSIFGTEKIPAFGFGMGEVTIRDFLTTHNLIPEIKSETFVMVTTFDDSLSSVSNDIANKLRQQNINTVVGIGKLDKQLKNANQQNIEYVLIIGPDEMKREVVKVKKMFDRSENDMKLNKFIDLISKNIKLK